MAGNPKQKRPGSRAREHARVEHFEFRLGGKPVLRSRMGPALLHAYARDFLEAADALAPPPAGVRFSPARQFLACRTLELVLKAFLSLRGVAMADMLDSVGHDLGRLLDRAESLGLAELVKLESPYVDEIRRASTYYAAKVFEYPALGETVRGYPNLPSSPVLLDAARILVTALQQPCIEAD
jgi:hypothetical protein